MKFIWIMLLFSIVDLKPLIKKTRKSPKNSSRQLDMQDIFEIVLVVVIIDYVLNSGRSTSCSKSSSSCSKRRLLINKQTGKLKVSKLEGMMEKAMRNSNNSKRRLIQKVYNQIFPLDKAKRNFIKGVAQQKIQVKSIQTKYTPFRSLLKVMMNKVLKYNEKETDKFVFKNGRSIYKLFKNQQKIKKMIL